ncbi:MAG: hypothetical protein LC648_00700 [Novosphingobium sp.]|nr:hypothetical protein [Novosphingobium sp.]
MRTGPLTGLLGGSFNPAHRGHRRISLLALDALALDEVWWLVTPGNPLKPREGLAPIAARVAAGPAMAWLRRYRRRPETLNDPAKRSAPALYLLRFDPDPRSSTAIRAADPGWHRRYVRAPRDAVTHRPIPVDAA